MMNEKKSYKVHIFEEQYILVSDDSEETVVQAADMVDKYMKEISQQSVITDPKKIAVLAALRIANKLLGCESLFSKGQEEKIALIEYIDKELSL